MLVWFTTGASTFLSTPRLLQTTTALRTTAWRVQTTARHTTTATTYCTTPTAGRTGVNCRQHSCSSCRHMTTRMVSTCSGTVSWAVHSAGQCNQLGSTVIQAVQSACSTFSWAGNFIVMWVGRRVQVDFAPLRGAHTLKTSPDAVDALLPCMLETRH